LRKEERKEKRKGRRRGRRRGGGRKLRAGRMVAGMERAGRLGMESGRGD
jgi:hypothetical protein